MQRRPSVPVPPVRPPVPPAQGPTRVPVVQRFGWAILDSQEEDDDPDIVRNNLLNSSALYSNPQRREVTTDPDPNADVDQVHLLKDEPVHLHAHGTAAGFGGFKAESLAKVVRKKFDNLRGRTILLHGCEVGSGQFLKDFLKSLANNNFQGWNGTIVCGPTRLLVVTEGGLSQVSKPGVESKDLKTRTSQQGKLMKKGEAWKGIEVVNQAIQDISDENTKRIVIMAMKNG